MIFVEKSLVVRFFLSLCSLLFCSLLIFCFFSCFSLLLCTTTTTLLWSHTSLLLCHVVYFQMTEFLDGKYSIGQRILDADEYRGTIQYIGPVASAKKASDIWLGNVFSHSLVNFMFAEVWMCVILYMLTLLVFLLFSSLMQC